MKKLFCALLSILMMLSCFVPLLGENMSLSTTVYAADDGDYKKVSFLSKHSINAYLGSTVRVGYEDDVYFDRCNDCISDGYGHPFEIEVDNQYTYQDYAFSGSIISAKEDDDDNSVLIISCKKVGKVVLRIYAQDDYDYEEDYDGVYDEITINVIAVPASKITVTEIKPQKYTGSNITPTPTVKFEKQTLVKNKDYTLSYKNNKNIGTATVVITLKGSYSGTIKKSFKIVPTISKTTASAYIGQSFTLSVKSSAKVSWKSSKTSVAKVSGAGKVTAVGKGTATITATSGGYSLTCKVTVKGISLNVTNKTLYVCQTYALKVSGNGSVKWKSSNANVASVSSKGVVTAKASGNATITATVGGTSASCKVTVKNQALSETKITIYTGKTKKLKLNGAVKAVTWSSSNNQIATVDKNGTVKGKKAGTAKIYAKHNSKTYTCTVTIKKTATKPAITVNSFTWDINSAGGVEPEITLTNNRSKTIKYIDFTIYFYDRFREPVYNEIGYYNYENMRIVGPIASGKKDTYYWKPVFYNSQVSAIGVFDFLVTYTDNTTEKVKCSTLWHDEYYYYK